jgi:hypothetical protein
MLRKRLSRAQTFSSILLRIVLYLFYKSKTVNPCIGCNQKQITTSYNTMMIAPLQTSINYNMNTVDKRPLYEPTKSTRKIQGRSSKEVKKNLISSTTGNGSGRQRSKTYITNPTDYDVLCIKDKTWARHVGNRIYRERVLTLASQYDSASKQDKMKITRSIVQLMQTKYYSRFLRQVHDDLWEIITDKQARDKTSHALRFAAKTKTTGCVVPTISASNSVDDGCCEQTVVSTSSSYDHNKQEGRERNVSMDECEEQEDEDGNEEEESIDSQEYRQPEEQAETIVQSNTVPKSNWNDDSFLMKCATILDIDPKELNHTEMYANEQSNGQTDALYHKQQSRLQSMQRQYQYQHDQGNEDGSNACIPEETHSSAQKWTSYGENEMKNRTNETTNMFLDMSLSLDDVFNYDPTLNASNGTTAIKSGAGSDYVQSFNVQDFDDFQLFDDRY